MSEVNQFDIPSFSSMPRATVRWPIFYESTLFDIGISAENVLTNEDLVFPFPEVPYDAGTESMGIKSAEITSTPTGGCFDILTVMSCNSSVEGSDA